MFLGHFGVGFGAKKAAPNVSLGTLFLAAQFVDLLWPLLLLGGFESVRVAPGVTEVVPLDFVSYPISHSLIMGAIWGAALGCILWLVRRQTKASIVVALAVLSHWVLDWLVHRPDLPLIPGSSARFGLGLWSSLPLTLAAEVVLFGLGLGLYLKTTWPTSRKGSWGLWTLVAFLIAIYASSVFGPPPPSETAVAWAGQAQWLLVAWAYWLDRHRQPVAGA